MLHKKILPLLMCCLCLLSLSIPCFAETIENEKVYKPLDLVVVVDSSGSMRYSDKNRTALEAVRMLVNMMPAEDSRVGIISFNTEASVLTKGASGDNSLIGLKEFTGVETIRTDVSTIVYDGGTGIGNAVKAATDLLSSKSDNEHTKAVILFTDGINDFGYNKLALSECEENEIDAIKWAKTNDCCIYCVGYDYSTDSGVSSMGAGGEGLIKLQNIANSTGGICRTIHNISDIEQLLIDFLADVCDLNYKTIATIPGDGGSHDCVIPVSPSVVEANIRIAGGDINSIKEGKIRLFNPSGKEIQLQNSGNVRYAPDATAASIKVIMPMAGDWRLTVNGISGEDIHVGLLEHYKMNLTSQLIFPEGNPSGVAYTNDVIGIKTWLTYEDKDAIYKEKALEYCKQYEIYGDQMLIATQDDTESSQLRKKYQNFTINNEYYKIFYFEGNYTQARFYLNINKQALMDYIEKSNVSNSGDMAGIFRNYARLQRATCQYEEAIDSCEKAYMYFVEAFSTNNARIVTYATALIECCIDGNEYSKAALYLSETKKIADALFTSDHPIFDKLHGYEQTINCHI